MKRSRQSDGDRNSTEREESYFRSQSMKLEKKRGWESTLSALLCSYGHRVFKCHYCLSVTGRKLTSYFGTSKVLCRCTDSKAISYPGQASDYQSKPIRSFQSVQLDCSAINTFVQKTRGAKWAKHFPFLKQSLYIKEGCWKCCGFWRISVLKCLVIRCEVSMFPTSKVPFSCHTTCMYRRSMRYDCKVYI